uniref:Uncharacterized protein n=1 Tax=Helianthus annuus TaxID=4232 RepID=A0A251UI04_HELAN
MDITTGISSSRTRLTFVDPSLSIITRALSYKKRNAINVESTRFKNQARMNSRNSHNI